MHKVKLWKFLVIFLQIFLSFKNILAAEEGVHCETEETPRIARPAPAPEPDFWRMSVDDVTRAPCLPVQPSGEVLRSVGSLIRKANEDSVVEVLEGAGFTVVKENPRNDREDPCAALNDRRKAEESMLAKMTNIVNGGFSDIKERRAAVVCPAYFPPWVEEACRENKHLSDLRRKLAEKVEEVKRKTKEQEAILTEYMQCVHKLFPADSRGSVAGSCALDAQREKLLSVTVAVVEEHIRGDGFFSFPSSGKVDLVKREKETLTNIFRFLTVGEVIFVLGRTQDCRIQMRPHCTVEKEQYVNSIEKALGGIGLVQDYIAQVQKMLIKKEKTQQHLNLLGQARDLSMELIYLLHLTVMDINQAEIQTGLIRSKMASLRPRLDYLLKRSVGEMIKETDAEHGEKSAQALLRKLQEEIDQLKIKEGAIRIRLRKLEDCREGLRESLAVYKLTTCDLEEMVGEINIMEQVFFQSLEMQESLRREEFLRVAALLKEAEEVFLGGMAAKEQKGTLEKGGEAQRSQDEIDHSIL